MRFFSFHYSTTQLFGYAALPLRRKGAKMREDYNSDFTMKSSLSTSCNSIHLKCPFGHFAYPILLQERLNGFNL